MSEITSENQTNVLNCGEISFHTQGLVTWSGTLTNMRIWNAESLFSISVNVFGDASNMVSQRGFVSRQVSAGIIKMPDGLDYVLCVPQGAIVRDLNAQKMVQILLPGQNGLPDHCFALMVTYPDNGCDESQFIKSGYFPSFSYFFTDVGGSMDSYDVHNANVIDNDAVVWLNNIRFDDLTAYVFYYLLFSGMAAFVIGTEFNFDVDNNGVEVAPAPSLPMAYALLNGFQECHVPLLCDRFKVQSYNTVGDVISKELTNIMNFNMLAKLANCITPSLLLNWVERHLIGTLDSDQDPGVIDSSSRSNIGVVGVRAVSQINSHVYHTRSIRFTTQLEEETFLVSMKSDVKIHTIVDCDSSMSSVAERYDDGFIPKGLIITNDVPEGVELTSTGIDLIILKKFPSYKPTFAEVLIKKNAPKDVVESTDMNDPSPEQSALPTEPECVTPIKDHESVSTSSVKSKNKKKIVKVASSDPNVVAEFGRFRTKASSEGRDVEHSVVTRVTPTGTCETVGGIFKTIIINGTTKKELVGQVSVENSKYRVNFVLPSNKYPTPKRVVEPMSIANAKLVKTHILGVDGIEFTGDSDIKPIITYAEHQLHSFYNFVVHAQASASLVKDEEEKLKTEFPLSII